MFLSLPPSCGSRGQESHWSSKPDVLRAHLSGAGLKSWGAQYGVLTLHSSGRNSGFWVPSPLWVAAPAFPTCFNAVSLLFTRCEGVTPPVFRFFSEEIVPYIAINSVCLWQEVSLGSSYVAILNRNLVFLTVAILTGIRCYLIAFWFTFPWWLMILRIFSCSCCLLWKNVYLGLLPIF